MIDLSPLLASSDVRSEAMILLLLIRYLLLLSLCVGGLCLFLDVRCGSQYPF